MIMQWIATALLAAVGAFVMILTGCFVEEEKRDQAGVLAFIGGVLLAAAIGLRP